MKIYTRSGDDGQTSLFGGDRIGKDSVRVSAYGAVDELNSIIGWVRAHGLPEAQDKTLHQVQNDLFRIGSDLAKPENNNKDGAPTRLDEGSEVFMEGAIDKMEKELTPLTYFILPGGSPPAVALHVMRTVCRRAEREIVGLAKNETVNPAIIKYLNRLSDLCFVMARFMNKTIGCPDLKWEK
ncbi:MAG: cob(I)yrinic acid a,c-diamide adenosyltransferase [Calditrichaeota bacterium]|nr:cob(I)yrinic acid a,c-diamide adenosyltransferase [Calditrichota bacterium]